MYLTEKSVPPRDFGQLQTVVMFSGPGYDFRQGCQRFVARQCGSHEVGRREVLRTSVDLAVGGWG